MERLNVRDFQTFVYLILFLHLFALLLGLLLLLRPDLLFAGDVGQHLLAGRRFLCHGHLLHLQLLVEDLYLLRGLVQFRESAAQPRTLVTDVLVLLAEEFRVGADKVEVVFGSDVVRATQFLLELFAELAD